MLQDLELVAKILTEFYAGRQRHRCWFDIHTSINTDVGDQVLVLCAVYGAAKSF